MTLQPAARQVCARISARSACYGFGEMESHAEVLELLEAIATFRPERLPVLAEVLRAAGVAGPVATSWGVEVEQLAEVAGDASARLDRFERRRGGWDLEGLAAPMACAIADLAEARSRRVAVRRRQLLERLGRKLADVVGRERIRRGLVAFLEAPGRSVDVSRYLPERGPPAL